MTGRVCLRGLLALALGAALLAACGPQAPAPTPTATPRSAGGAGPAPTVAPPTPGPSPTPAPPTETPAPSATPRPTPGPGLDDLLATPLAAYTNADLESAAAGYAGLATLYPRSADPWLGQAAVAQRAANPEAALEFLRQAVAADPASFEGWRQQAVLHERAGRYADAAEAYTQMLALQPEDASLYVARALARARLGEIDGAVADLTAAQQRDPFREYAWLNAAGGAFAARAYAAAAEIAAAGASFYPTSAALPVMEGQARLALGEDDAALAALDRALAADPASLPAHRWRGEALARLGRPDEAAAALQQAAEIGVAEGSGQRAAGFESMALAAQVLARSNPDAAFRYLAEMSGLHGQPSGLLYGYALVDYERGEMPNAYNRFTSLIDLFGYPEAYYWRGVVNAQEGRDARAAEDLEAYLALRPAGPTAEAARALLAEVGGE